MDELLILAIETATEFGSVSLTSGTYRQGRILAEVNSQPQVTHSKRLLGSIAWLLKQVDVEYNEIAGIAVSSGPGSFTGLRIGMAAAKGIAMACGAKFFSIPTLDGLAFSCGHTERLICCLIDARKHEVYAAFYRPNDNSPPTRISEYRVLRPQDLLRGIEEPLLVVGNGVDVYHDLFKDNTFIKIAPTHSLSPRASAIGFLAGDLLASGKEDDPVLAAPMYVRASEAELLYGKRNREKIQEK